LIVVDRRRPPLLSLPADNDDHRGGGAKTIASAVDALLPIAIARRRRIVVRGL
jgi:hypothetical protein